LHFIIQALGTTVIPDEHVGWLLLTFHITPQR